MDQTHIHLLITHLPIFGSILGGLVLLHGIWTKSNQTAIAAYNLFIISAIGAGIAYLTGEAAEETVENIQGVAKTAIDAHEDFAMVSLVSLIVLGVAALIGIVLTLKKSQLTRSVAIVTLLIALVSFGLIARTGYLGGQIRHTELNAGTTNTAMPADGEKEKD
jgi:uncharacterized membrane protein